jgi:hypothetical protein
MLVNITVYCIENNYNKFEKENLKKHLFSSFGIINHQTKLNFLQKPPPKFKIFYSLFGVAFSF